LQGFVAGTILAGLVKLAKLVRAGQVVRGVGVGSNTIKYILKAFQVVKPSHTAAPF